MYLSWLFISFVWAQTIPWQDGDFGCIDQGTAQRYVRDYNINTRSFGGMELCNAKVDTKKLFNDLAIIENGNFADTPNDNVFIRGIIPLHDYYKWMKSETRGMNRGNDVPAATAYNRMGYFTMQDGWALLSTLGRVGTVIHEARHTAGYRHIACRQGPYQDASLAGCDRDYEYGGSHAVEMEYYARVSVLGTNFHPVYKTMARLMGIARSNFVFNKPVIQKKEAMLALSSTTGRADLLTEEGYLFEREAPMQEGILKRTSFGGVIYNGRDAWSIELYGNVPLHTPLQDTYSYFKLLLEDQNPAFQFEEFDLGSKRFAIKMKDNQSLQFFEFPQGRWGRVINTNFTVATTATRLENGQNGLFLISREGAIYPVDPQRKAIGGALPFAWNPEVAQVAQLGERLYVLKQDGVIYQKTDSRRYQPVGISQDRYRGLINVPIYNGFNVEP